MRKLFVFSCLRTFYQKNILSEEYFIRTLSHHQSDHQIFNKLIRIEAKNQLSTIISRSLINSLSLIDDINLVIFFYAYVPQNT